MNPANSPKSLLSMERLTTMSQVALHMRADLQFGMAREAPKGQEAVKPGSLVVDIGEVVTVGGVGSVAGVGSSGRGWG